MYSLILAGITSAVLAVLALFNPGSALEAIAAGDASYFNVASWQNPFKQVSFLDLADSSVAFFADRLVPAVVPGTTSTGRPYIVSLADQVNLTDHGNLTVPATTPLNLSDPVVLMSLIKASVHVDREPFTWLQGILCVGVASVFIFLTVLLVGLVIWRGYRAESKSLQAMVRPLQDFVSQLRTQISNQEQLIGFLRPLQDTVEQLRTTISNQTQFIELVERLCKLTKSKDLRASEPLDHRHTELYAAGQTPYLPDFTSQIDLVLYTIDTAQANYDSYVRSQQSLDTMRRERDAALSRCGDLEESLAEKTADFDEVNSELKQTKSKNKALESALSRKTADCNNIHGQLVEANKKRSGLESQLDNVQGKLQVAQTGFNAILYGPHDMEVACNTQLPCSNDEDLNDPKPAVSAASLPASGLDPTARSSKPVGRPEHEPSVSPPKSASPVNGQGASVVSGSGYKETGQHGENGADKPARSEPLESDSNRSSPTPHDGVGTPASQPTSHGADTTGEPVSSQEQRPGASTSEGTNDSAPKSSPTPEDTSTPSSTDPTIARGRSEHHADTSTTSTRPRPLGSPIRSTMEDLHVQLRRSTPGNDPGAAAAAQYAGSFQSTDNHPPFVQPRLADARGRGRGRGAGWSSSGPSGYRGGASGPHRRGGPHNNSNNTGSRQAHGADTSTMSTFMQELLKNGDKPS